LAGLNERSLKINRYLPGIGALALLATLGCSNPPESQTIADYGLKKRDDRDVCHAVYIPRRFSFEGPAASPQVFENGGVIVEQEGEFRGVQPEVFVRTYWLLDGRPITSLAGDLKTWRQE
jgi:hypothetical protein